MNITQNNIINKNNIIIKKGDLKNLNAVIKISLKYFGYTYDVEFWKDMIKNGIFYISENEEEEIIGYILSGYIPTNYKEIKQFTKQIKTINLYTIISLVVIKKYQNQGIANNLLKLTLNEIKKKNINIIVLEVRTSNGRAIKLYKKNGFEIYPIKLKNYYNKPKEDAYFMIKKIDK